MLRTLIIDDEAHIRNTLTRLLKLCCPKVKIVGEASGMVDGISKIKKIQPDLVFLDINLRDGTGYEMLHQIQPIRFKVIFISAFDKNTIQAFKLSSLTYLVKPFNPVELMRVVKESESAGFNHFELLLEALEANLNSD